MKTCKRCGGFEFNAKGECRPCTKVVSASYRAANIEKIKLVNAAWREVNREKNNAACAAWDAANREKVKARKAAKHAANPERDIAIRAAWNEKNREKNTFLSAAKYLRSRERISKLSAARYAANPAQIRLRNEKWKAANPEKSKAIVEAWRLANPDATRVQRQNRRARSAGGVLSRGLAAKLFKLQKGKCPCCKQPLAKTYHLDHVVPLALGGANTDDNIQLLRQRCNNQKHAKHPVDFMQSRGFLL